MEKLELGACASCIEPAVGDVVFRPIAHRGPIMLRPDGTGKYKNIGACIVVHEMMQFADYAMSGSEQINQFLPRCSWVQII